jgi:hypothetical protein
MFFVSRHDKLIQVEPYICNDISDARALYPCTIKADGNCLPSCGSVFGYGSDTNSAEIRVRIVTELEYPCMTCLF